MIRDLPRLVEQSFALQAVILYVRDEDQFYASIPEVPPDVQAGLRALTEARPHRGHAARGAVRVHRGRAVRFDRRAHEVERRADRPPRFRGVAALGAVRAGRARGAGVRREPARVPGRLAHRVPLARSEALSTAGDERTRETL